MARRFGYSRVSISDQDWSLQLETLTKAGVDDRDISREKAFGVKGSLRGRQEISELRRWSPSPSPVLIFTASATTRSRSDQATVQIQRLIPDNL